MHFFLSFVIFCISKVFGTKLEIKIPFEDVWIEMHFSWKAEMNYF